MGRMWFFSLGEELAARPLNINELIKEAFPKGDEEIPFTPKILKGKDIANVVDVSFSQPKVAVCKKHKVLRFIDLFAGIGGIRCGLELAAKEKGLKACLCLYFRN